MPWKKRKQCRDKSWSNNRSRNDSSASPRANPEGVSIRPASHMSFFFPRQIQRISYLLRMLASFLPCILLGFLIAYLGHAHPQLLQNSFTRPLLWLFTIAWYAYLLCFIVAPRFLDIGLPRICLLLAFFPGANLVLALTALFAPTGWCLRFRAKLK